MKSELQVVWEVGCLLGEGPAWFAGEQALRFVDIKAGLLHQYDPRTGRGTTLKCGGQPSFVLPTADGAMLVGSNCDLLQVEQNGSAQALHHIVMPKYNRTNDGVTDSQGRVWFGTMDDAERQRTGALWCLNKGKLYELGCPAVVTNGPAISRDGHIAYFVDSPERTIWRLKIGTGEGGAPLIESRSIFTILPPDAGYPDGVVLDAEGCLWVALWDGWGVRRYSPKGELIHHVELPCARVTKMTFGGSDLRTAFVTTARTGLDDAELRTQPHAGALFTFEPGVAGNPLPAAAVST